jgi:hypothetical protein
MELAHKPRLDRNLVQDQLMVLLKLLLLPPLKDLLKVHQDHNLMVQQQQLKLLLPATLRDLALKKHQNPFMVQQLKLLLARHKQQQRLLLITHKQHKLLVLQSLFLLCSWVS